MFSMRIRIFRNNVADFHAGESNSHIFFFLQHLHIESALGDDKE